MYNDGANIGINTSSPSAKLHINGGDLKLAATLDATPYMIKSYGDANGLWLIPGHSSLVPNLVLANSLNHDKSVSFKYQITSGKGDLRIGQQSRLSTNPWTHATTKLYTNGSPRLTITAAGDVGIGTTSPSAKLHVVGDLHVTSTMVVDGSIYAEDSSGVGLRDDGSNVGVWVRDGGRVGVGTTSPGAKLDVAGDLIVDDDAQLSGDVKVNGNLTVSGRAITGWKGSTSEIMVTPYDLRPSYDGANWKFENTGGHVRFYSAANAYYMTTIPVGYKITGFSFKFTNEPNSIQIKYGSIDSSTVISLTPPISSGTSSGVITKSANFTLNYDDARYVVFHIVNDALQEFRFIGGRVYIAKCSSGCL